MKFKHKNICIIYFIVLLIITFALIYFKYDYKSYLTLEFNLTPQSYIMLNFLDTLFKFINADYSIL